jgi:hypothetical protein
MIYKLEGLFDLVWLDYTAVGQPHSVGADTRWQRPALDVRPGSVHNPAHTQPGQSVRIPRVDVAEEHEPGNDRLHVTTA